MNCILLLFDLNTQKAECRIQNTVVMMNESVAGANILSPYS